MRIGLLRFGFSVGVCVVIGASCGDDDSTASSDAGPGGDSGGGVDSGPRLDSGPRDASADGGSAACTTDCEIIELAAGFKHNCALRASGQVLCWGENFYGQLGDGVSRHADDCTPVGAKLPVDCSATPVVVSGLTDAAHISSRGAFANGAIRTGGEVVYWGIEGSARSGFGEPMQFSTPAAVEGIASALELDVGIGHACARTSATAISCWGSNYGGELTGTDTIETWSMVSVMGITDAVELDVGTVSSHTCVRHASGDVSCWGSNSVGQLGDGMTAHRTCGSGLSTFDCSTTPVRVLRVGDAEELALGGDFTCARRTSGGVSCWGSNQAGQLGDGTTDDRTSETSVTGVEDAVEIAAGHEFACARRTSGQVVCWGSNDKGQLGDGTMSGHGTCMLGSMLVDCSSTAVDVMGLGDAVEIVGGFRHACARRSSGAVVCWGWNQGRQVGDGSQEDQYAPQMVRIP